MAWKDATTQALASVGMRAHGSGAAGDGAESAAEEDES
jgi:hypothetical protein